MCIFHSLSHCLRQTLVKQIEPDNAGKLRWKKAIMVVVVVMMMMIMMTTTMMTMGYFTLREASNGCLDSM